MNNPVDSTKNIPVKYSKFGFPDGCFTPEAKKIIEDYESGRLAMEDFPCDDSVPGIWQTWDENGGTKKLPGGKVTRPGQYGWKFLSDKKQGAPMGISVRFGPYDNEPHFHREAEWFYVLEGETLLNVNGKLQPFKKGDIVFFEENAIHDMVIVKPAPFAHLWGFPHDSDWKTFQYYKRENTMVHPAVQSVFDSVDEMRLAIDLAPNGKKNLPQGVVPVGQWWKKNRHLLDY